MWDRGANKEEMKQKEGFGNRWINTEEHYD